MTPTEEKIILKNPSRAAEFRELLGKRVIVADGGMATSLFTRGVLPTRCLEELNVSLPAMVRDVHREFMRAGSEILRTNTFGANKTRLARFGLSSRVGRFNHAAVRIAREAAGGEAYVAGSMGPLGEELAPLGSVDAVEARGIFKEQAAALVAAGVDLIVLETFQHLNELTEAVSGVREAAAEIVLVAEIAVDEEGYLPDGTTAAQAASILDALPVDVIGVNCGTGPRAAFLAFQEMAKATGKFLSAMPAAGEGSPRYFADYAKQFAEHGAAIVGGCCMSTADHLFAAKEAIGESTVVEREPELETTPAAMTREETEIAERSYLGRALAGNRHILLADLPSPRVSGAPVHAIVELAKVATAICVHGGPGRISSVAGSGYYRGHAKADTVLVADFGNASSARIRQELAGAALGGTKNVLAQGAQALTVVNLAGGMLCGVEIPAVWRADTPEFLKQCVDAGAAFLVTSPLFDFEDAERLAERVKGLSVPVVATVRILSDAGDAEFVREELRIAVPDSVVETLREQSTSGVHIAVDLAARIAPLFAGIRVQAGTVEDQLEVLSGLATKRK